MRGRAMRGSVDPTPAFEAGIVASEDGSDHDVGWPAAALRDGSAMRERHTTDDRKLGR